MRWAVVFQDDVEMLAVRADQQLRDAHVAFARAHPELLIGGGLAPDVEADFCGALWVVEAATRAEVVALIEADPFYVPAHRRYDVFTWGKILEDQFVTL
ncbi:YciI family protein [Phaeobacter sp.]|uniref:YciI family protein n=1 Tax=Phaeobacter sp. TaxID=1902409 RepID=UPI0025F14351|nr:YciI family protein [Phaeobacter sp.]